MRLDVIRKSRGVLSALEKVRSMLEGMGEEETREFFGVRTGRLLKTTISLCPECLGHAPAMVYCDVGRVLMRKRCVDHGASDALVESDENFYWLSNKDQWGRRFDDGRVMEFASYAGSCCGDGGCGESDGDVELP